MIQYCERSKPPVPLSATINFHLFSRKILQQTLLDYLHAYYLDSGIAEHTCASHWQRKQLRKTITLVTTLTKYQYDTTSSGASSDDVPLNEILV